MNKKARHNRIFFRADANSAIGHGHLMRISALAEMLYPQFYCIFLFNDTPASIRSMVSDSADEIHLLPTTQNIEEEAKVISTQFLQKEDIIVIDGYQFTTAYQETIRKVGCKIVCIDDLIAQHFVADLVINTAGGLHPEQYSTEIYTRMALGPTYALLREPFRSLAPRSALSVMHHLLICFGGADSPNLTEQYARIMVNMGIFQEIHLIVGASYQHMATLKSWSDSFPTVHIHQQLDAEGMVRLMQHCHLAIAPSSTISYELCRTGIGLLTGYTVDNQKNIARFLDQSTCGISLGDLQQIDAVKLEQLLKGLTLKQLNQQLRKQNELFQLEATRYQKQFYHLALEKTLTIRKANQADLMLYFEWANDEETRKQAIHPEKITLENHSSWFIKKLQEPEDYLFIFEREEPVGQVRFDFFEGSYVISYSVDKRFRGQGLGTVLIKMGLEKLQTVLGYRPLVIAYVKPTNHASLKVFHHNSFKIKGLRSVNNISLELFEK